MGTDTKADLAPNAVLEIARRVLTEEADALRAIIDRLDDHFVRAVEIVLQSAGRVVVTGMGKSGLVGRKIAATLASTGTPALFLHPGEARHGDLGMVAPGDIALILSYSGETDEVLAILPSLRQQTSCLVAMTGAPLSTLGQAADAVLDVCVVREACALQLAPTTSTTAMIALGDALAVAVMEARQFGREDYARLHPAGSLGRRLLVRVYDVMRREDALPVVLQSATLHDALFEMTGKHAGATCVVDRNGRLCGILTDGDVRRYLLRDTPNALHETVSAAMTDQPRVVTGNPLAWDALMLFEISAVPIGDLPVLDEDGRPVGLLLLKDLVRAGIVPPGQTLRSSEEG